MMQHASLLAKTAAAAALLPACLLAPRPSPAAPLLFVEDFEKGELTQWKKEASRDYSVRIVDAPARAGKRAVRFELHKDDPLTANSKRTELKLDAEPAGQERWYGFSIFLPEDWADDPVGEIVAQWHERPDRDLGEEFRVPPLFLSVSGGNWDLGRRWDSKPLTTKAEGHNPGPTGGKESVELGPLRKGAWADWVFHVKWSYKGDGLLEVWKDGKQVFRKEGPNTYNDKSGNYFKIGMYKSGWKNRPEKSTTVRRVLFHDEIRIGDARARYEDVAPPAKAP